MIELARGGLIKPCGRPLIFVHNDYTVRSKEVIMEERETMADESGAEKLEEVRDEERGSVLSDDEEEEIASDAANGIEQPDDETGSDEVAES